MAMKRRVLEMRQEVLKAVIVKTLRAQVSSCHDEVGIEEMVDLQLDSEHFME